MMRKSFLYSLVLLVTVLAACSSNEDATADHQDELVEVETARTHSSVPEPSSPTREEIMQFNFVEGFFGGNFVVYENGGTYYMCDFSQDEHAFDAMFNDDTSCSDGMKYEQLEEELIRVGEEWFAENMPDSDES